MSREPQIEALVSAREVAEVLSIHEKTVRDMALAGRLPGFKIGQCWRFRLSEIDEWVKRQLASSRHPLPTKGAVA